MRNRTRAGSAIATGTAITLGRFQLRVSEDGGLAQLLDQESGRDWSRGRDLFRVWWEGFGVAEYEAFWNAYIANADNPEVRSWAEYDFQKPGLARSRPAHGARDFRIADLTADADGRKLRIVLASSAEAKAAGAPGRVELRYVFDARKPAFHLDLFWRDKLASRLPEATWLSFDPAMDHPDSWRLDKLGQAVSPAVVRRGGGTSLHAVGRGARYDAADGRIDFQTLDAALIAPDRPRLLDYRADPAPPRGGLHVNLHNNVWGTNFPAWYGEDTRFRFRVALEPAAA